MYINKQKVITIVLSLSVLLEKIVKHDRIVWEHIEMWNSFILDIC